MINLGRKKSIDSKPKNQGYIGLRMCRFMVRCNRHFHEDKCQQWEDKRLDKSDEYLKAVEWNRREIRWKEANYCKKNFSRKNITE